MPTDRLKYWLACSARAAAAAALALVAYAVYQATPAVLGILANAGTASARVSALIGDVERDETGKPTTIARLIATTDATVAAGKTTLRESSRTISAARPVLTEAGRDLKDTRVTVRAAKPVLIAAEQSVLDAQQTIVEMRGKINPALDQARGVVSQVNAALPDFLVCGDANRNCLFNRWAGVSWQAEQTLRAIARSANRVEKAVPNFLDTWDRIGKNSDKTTQATAEVMGNFARATKPLPTWMRLGLSIAPPVVQAGATVVTTMAIKGKHR